MGARGVVGQMPQVGRSAERARFREWLAVVERGHGGAQFVAGPAGIGKTRLVTSIAADAAASGKWQCGVGSVFAVESGVPYAVWSDALASLLRPLDADARRVLTRGSGWLASVCPAFATEVVPEDPEARDGKARLLWNCAQFLARLGERRPVLLVLENLHLADAASLELLHFVVRQAVAARVAIVATYNELEIDRQPALREVEQSLLTLNLARLQRLTPLTEADTEQLVCEAFGVEHAGARQLARRLYAWTSGNPFFVEEALRALVEEGRLQQRDGRWIGWDVRALDLPRTVRLTVSQRLERLSEPARTLARVASVIGAHVRLPLLRATSDLPEAAVLAGLDELVRAGLLVENRRAEAGGGYDFAHPILQDVIYDAMGAARSRAMHARVARELEASLGDAALDRADQLAFHYARAEPEDSGDKAVRYLSAAGRAALARHADRAAADYLGAAFARSRPGTDAEMLMDDLAQARQRLGDYDGAMTLWRQAADAAASAGHSDRRARVGRRMGVACYWGGRFEEALDHLDAALDAAARAGDDAMRAQILLTRGSCWQSLGKVDDAERELAEALRLATALGDRALLARAHRALLFLHIFVGPPARALAHGEQALSLAGDIGDGTTAWAAHYGLATLAGLTGDGAAVARHVERSEALAGELQSPVLAAYSDEVSMQYLFATGDWDAGVAVSERSIATARALGQRTLLPRVLVWANSIHLARGEFDLAKQYLDEAWDVGVARAAKGQRIEVHSEILAYAGRAAYHLARGEYAAAIDAGEEGLRIADRVGYAVWAVYRLLPVTTEAALWSRDMALAERLRDRLQRDCERMNHRLGLVWVAAADGLIARLQDEDVRAEALLRGAIADLERIPWVFDAARLRRWRADVLIRLNRLNEAADELRTCHETCARLGALLEVDRARVTMKRLGMRLPAKATSRRAKLTVRESDIAQLVINRKANKEIAAALGIATRTVTTHVANIFGKLGVTSRAELADRLRDAGFADG